MKRARGLDGLVQNDRLASGSGAAGAPLRTLGSIVLGAAALCWPALLNRYPLLYPDSVTYVTDGWDVLRGLRAGPEPSLGPMRAPLYSLEILALHGGRSAWGVVAANAVLVAMVLWLTLRAVAGRRRYAPYLLLMAGLSALTSVSWYASLLMPDVLGACLYLAAVLLAFCPGRFSRAERCALGGLVVVGATGHATHLLLLGGVCVGLLALCVQGRRSGAPNLRRVALLWALLVLAAGLQIALNKRLYGEAVLTARRTPFLLARLIADGPARRFLREHCAPAGSGTAPWALCAHINELPGNDDQFLWDPRGVWARASPAEQNAIRRQELPLAAATLRAYPADELRLAARASLAQLLDFGVDDFDNNTWMAEALPHALRDAGAAYPRTRQAHDALPCDFWTRVQQVVVGASVLVLGGLLPWLWRRRALENVRRWCGLAAVLLPVIVLNACLTATLSGQDARYQARVIWLVPLLAGMAALLRWDARRSAPTSPAPRADG